MAQIFNRLKLWYHQSRIFSGWCCYLLSICNKDDGLTFKISNRNLHIGHHRKDAIFWFVGTPVGFDNQFNKILQSCDRI
jgi:hypothetical protein